MYFDRFDICEAYYVLELNWHMGGMLRERPSNIRRNMSISFQLQRMGFKPRAFLNYVDLTENGKAIYDNALSRLQLG